jgi:4'-phosphopantetheinyl transferase EntD
VTALLAALLPATVACREAYDDALPAPLYDVEEALVARAVPGRRREFATARRCAREALADLGLAPAPIPAGPAREPCWPDGVVGSITHCAGYRAAAVARRADLASVGVDAEPHAPLPDGVLATIAVPEEAEWLAAAARDDPGVPWDRLRFTAKEAVYKAWYPLQRRWLGFEQVTVRFADATFTAVPGPAAGPTPVPSFAGRWLAGPDLLLAAVTVPAA